MCESSSSTPADGIPGSFSARQIQGHNTSLQMPLRASTQVIQMLVETHRENLARNGIVRMQKEIYGTNMSKRGSMLFLTAVVLATVGRSMAKITPLNQDAFTTLSPVPGGWCAVFLLRLRFCCVIVTCCTGVSVSELENQSTNLPSPAKLSPSQIESTAQTFNARDSIPRGSITWRAKT
jgi:hypothetical protein